MENSKHVLNKQLKRIEPVSKKCSFCLEGTMDDMSESYFVPVFRENDRTNIIVYRSVKYQKIDIGIPRCKACKAIHVSSKTKALIISLAAAMAIITFMIFNFLNFHAVVSVALFFLSAVTGFGGYAYLQNIFSRNAGISSLKDGAENDTLVQDFINQGWSLKQPSA
jgi:hypothetical protein